MRFRIWAAILIGSLIGGSLPQLWGDGMLSYSAVALSTVGSLLGIWLVAWIG